MQRIVCDTMIWYYLSTGELSLPNPKKYSLVCTHSTLTELAFTPNIFGKLHKVQEAVKQILNSASDILMAKPLDHARMIIDNDYNPEFNVEDDLVFAFLRVVMNHPSDGLLDNESKNQLTFIVSERNKNFEDWASFLNELNEPMKNMSSQLKRNHSQVGLKLDLRKLFMLRLNDSHNTNYTAEEIDWDILEFYEEIHSQYYRNLMFSKMKADSNDKYDLENMIYVQPNDLYWTKEKRWLRMAKETKLGKYLFLE